MEDDNKGSPLVSSNVSRYWYTDIIYLKFATETQARISKLRLKINASRSVDTIISHARFKIKVISLDSFENSKTLVFVITPLDYAPLRVNGNFILVPRRREPAVAAWRTPKRSSSGPREPLGDPLFFFSPPNSSSCLIRRRTWSYFADPVEPRQPWKAYRRLNCAPALWVKTGNGCIKQFYLEIPRRWLQRSRQVIAKRRRTGRKERRKKGGSEVEGKKPGMRRGEKGREGWGSRSVNVGGGRS